MYSPVSHTWSKEHGEPLANSAIETSRSMYHATEPRGIWEAGLYIPYMNFDTDAPIRDSAGLACVELTLRSALEGFSDLRRSSLELLDGVDFGGGFDGFAHEAPCVAC